MLLGYNTNGLTSHRLADALALLADEGYDAVALTPDVAHLDPMRASARQIDEVAHLVADLGLRTIVETGSRFALDPRRKHRPNLLERDAQERARRLDFLRRHIEIAAVIGAEVVSLWSGVLPKDVRPDEAREHLHRGLDELLADADRHNVVLGLEPEPGMWIETVADATVVFEAQGRPDRLGLTLDVGHLLVTGEGTVQDVLRSSPMRLVQVHLEDMKPGVHEHLAPGRGDVDFASTLRALQTSGYAGPVCWELSRSSHEAPEVVRLCRDVFRSSLLAL
ncbi:MAG: sugar phosphate isomerase/epimerase [Planctomycetes bacterium]|nr:sugar phosphate isomerase/epimerase [Planctomycetota bacterium]MCB9917545.1 sugar phosphate isomerase/epimerase [Planctomycetota bacterium]